jgi:hypothetical protein
VVSVTDPYGLILSTTQITYYLMKFVVCVSAINYEKY